MSPLSNTTIPIGLSHTVLDPFCLLSCTALYPSVTFLPVCWSAHCYNPEKYWYLSADLHIVTYQWSVYLLAELHSVTS